MPAKTEAFSSEFTSNAPDASNMRWFVCFLLFLATTINYMDRSVFSFIEPQLHAVPFMGWDAAADKFHQPVFDNNFGNVRSEEHTSELQSRENLVCRLLLEKKKYTSISKHYTS